jgi:hypothetical protein
LEIVFLLMVTSSASPSCVMISSIRRVSIEPLTALMIWPRAMPAIPASAMMARIRLDG